MVRTDKAVEVAGISKSFGTFRAVDEVSFEVYRGEIFAMLGPNGAGKSTTIRMILDILKPDTGTIRVLGAPINDRVKDRIGYLPEERGLYRNVRVLDMMIYLGELKGLPTRTARARSSALLEQLGLAESAKNKVSELSKGMQQKVQFAVTVLHEPELMIVDEPFSGLDPVNTLVVKELIADLRNKGTAIIMSTHQMSQVEEMADRMLMINRGHAALYGEVSAIRRQYANHAVIVEGEGNWERLPGVQRVERDLNDRRAVILHMEAHVTSAAILSQIASTPGYHVERFELAVPSLNDIFIQVAGGERFANGNGVTIGRGRRGAVDNG